MVNYEVECVARRSLIRKSKRSITNIRLPASLVYCTTIDKSAYGGEIDLWRQMANFSNNALFNLTLPFEYAHIAGLIFNNNT